jgi:catechol 2,3-dioxygenase-like lactoylglutathione lyase family enzyme
MATLPTSLGAITLFVDDVPRAKGFYQGAFDLEPIHEDDDSAAFKFENTIVNLLARPAAHELVEPATVAASGAGSSFQLTIWVEDTDALIEELRSRGIELLNGPIDREWGVRTATFSDPDGHVWEIAQELAAA